MATHSSTPAWEIPWTEEPGGLQSRGCRESDMTEVTQHARKAPLVGRKADFGVILSRSEWKHTVAMQDSFKQ